jgi:trehalose 6-phosphate phosphatase
VLYVQRKHDSGEANMDTAGPSFIPKLKECAILLDVDGTIVDLAPTPGAVYVSEALQDILSRLVTQTGGAVALVSGRPIRDLDLIFDPLVLTAIGGHGAEFRSINGAKSERRQAGPLDAGLRQELAAIAQDEPGIVVEDKGYSLALHYRLAPERAEMIREEVAKVAARFASQPIEILPGKSVVEVKQAGFNKATGVRALMKIPPFAGRVPIFIGDDVTDEPVFQIMPQLKGLAFSVGRQRPAAENCFKSPQDVRAWLQKISLEQEKASS